jgi:ABC-type branched-subunit amino acid transport system ATPase component/branched-subunit amino acid ABC-type transport system permease component
VLRDVFLFAVLGLGVGALYSLEALGVVLTYRASGILNFAQGAMGMTGAMFFYDLWQTHEWPWPLAFAVAVSIGAALGALTHLLVMRPLRHVSGVTRLIATLGVMIGLQYGMAWQYGVSLQLVPSFLPTDAVRPVADIPLGVDRLILIGVAAGLAVVLGLVYKYTRYGLRTTAVSENEPALAALGKSPDLLAAANWALGGALAVVVAILIAPIVGLDVTALTLIVLPAIAAATIGGYSSFPLTFAAGLAIGLIQSEVIRFVPVGGLSAAAPFLAIIGVLVIRGRPLPLRSEPAARMPTLGSMRIRPVKVLQGVVLVGLGIAFLPPAWIDALTTSLLFAIIVLSFVVLTGFCGQLSLAQLVLGGVGGWVATRLVAFHGVSFEWAFLVGVAASVVVGVIVGLPAVRTRGVNLAVVTLGLGAVIAGTLLTQPTLTGGVTGTVIGATRIFGIDVDSVEHPQRFAIVAAVLLGLLMLMVCNLGRSQTGRRMLAVRSNERAAAALGIDVPRTKLLAFAIASGIAGAGGILLAYRLPHVDFLQFSVLGSVFALLLAVIGGVGYVGGAAFGGVMAPQGLGWEPFVDHPEIQSLLMALSGVLLLLVLLLNPNGLAQTHSLDHLLAKLPRRDKPGHGKPAARDAVPVRAAPVERVEARSLQVRDLSVRLGGVRALENVTLEIRPGEVVGLVGPNGAGKTTLIDAVTGFVKPISGDVLLGEVSLLKQAASRRARSGVSRSFQSLELFEDMSVLDNLRVVARGTGRLSWLRDLVMPRTPQLSPAAAAALLEFGLTDDIQERLDGLPYGRRRLVAIARALASQPSVLLLDEPAAGLSAGERAELGQLLQRVAKVWGVGVLLVDHDMQVVWENCDRVYVLDFGHVIAEGTAAAVRADPAVVAAYLGEDADEVDESALAESVAAPAEKSGHES